MKFFNFFVLVFCLFACQNTPANAQEQVTSVVGKLENGKPVITVDKLKMIEIYNANLLRYSGIKAQFTQVEIVKNPSEDHAEEPYFLVFKGAAYSSSFVVTEHDSQLKAIAGISCTTSACAEEDLGCTPKATGWACRPCANKGKCTKTVTGFSLIE